MALPDACFGSFELPGFLVRKLLTQPNRPVRAHASGGWCEMESPRNPACVDF